MSLQDGTVENGPKPTYEHDETAKPTVEKETRLDMMKDWIKTCDEHHGSPCVLTKETRVRLPPWLIDVVDECVVHGVAERYLTLSYVWGGVKTLQLVKDNIGRLTQQGSLAKEVVTLPRTLREALEVTRLLGERYIFVDQLCIVQDDQQHKMSEIQNMADIYAFSYLTIVATVGDTADFGLVDCLDQWIHQSPSDLRTHDVDDVYPWVLERTDASAWNHRGWTFQEQRFTGRILYFLKLGYQQASWKGKDDPYRVSWECHRAAWHDLRCSTATEAFSTCLDKPGYQRTPPHEHGWPNFSQYQRDIRSYSPRQFTYDSDVIAAFAGTASSLAKIFPGGILYGLPILFFDVALLWAVPPNAIRRNIDATFPESTRPPSWSWMTWRGQLWGSNPYWNYFSLDGTDGVSVSPIVEWHYKRVRAVFLTKIESDLYRYKHLAQDSESAPPPRWSRTMSTSSKSNMCGKLCYVTPYAPGKEFPFPIPLVDTSDTVETPWPASNRITCRTERAYFSLYRPDKVWARAQAPALRFFPHIVDDTGSVSGKMMDTGDRPPEGAYPIILVELIAVSTTFVGDVPAGCPFTHLERDCPEARDFYNVLWIEWTDGIAYRKGVGFVTKEAWEAADRELIDVVLG